MRSQHKTRMSTGTGRDLERTGTAGWVLVLAGLAALAGCAPTEVKSLAPLPMPQIELSRPMVVTTEVPPAQALVLDVPKAWACRIARSRRPAGKTWACRTDRRTRSSWPRRA